MLFVLGIEILALAIIQNSKIQGIAVGSRVIKITQYADDATVFLRNQESMNVLLELPEKFERCSQLKINPRSQKLYGSENGRIEQIPLSTLSGQRNLSFVFRGVHFSNRKRTCDKLNFYDKLDALENTLNNWKRRKLTLLGKINVVKSLGLSKLIFIASVLPVPEKFCDQVNKITFNFIWDNKIAKIQRNTIIGERENGGLNMIDFYFGGVRSKGFATLRNVSKLPFFDKIRHAKSVGFRFYSAI